MIVLWTDALIYLLIAVMLSLGLYLRGKEHIQRPLQQIGRSKIGMVSLVVLLFFVSVGLLDSVHFKLADDKKKRDHQLAGSLGYAATGAWRKNLFRAFCDKLVQQGNDDAGRRLHGMELSAPGVRRQAFK